MSDTPSDKSSRLKELFARAKALEDEIEAELQSRRDRFGVRMEQGRAFFDAEVVARQRAAREKLLDYIRGIRPLVFLTAPVIYSVIVPFVLIDLWVTLYQRICFPVYGIPLVRRRDHIVLDRHHLAYLNGIEKFNCLYCSYGNGVVSYVREAAARTEAYWCPIKHARRWKGAHEHYGDFLDYGDEADFVAKWEASRVRLKQGGREE